MLDKLADFCDIFLREQNQLVVNDGSKELVQTKINISMTVQAKLLNMLQYDASCIYGVVTTRQGATRLLK